MFAIKRIDLKDNKKVLMENLSISFPNNSFNLIATDTDLLKNSLIDAFSCLKVEKKGTVTLDDETVNKMNIGSFRNSKISVISNKYDFLDDLTIKENANLCLNLYNSYENKLNDIHEVVNLSLSEINEKEYLNKKNNELPNIIQFKFSLVMALIKNPKVLIFDNPTNGFSNQTALEIVKILKELSKNHIIIIFSNNTDLYSEYSDQIILFQLGSLKFQKKLEVEKIGTNNDDSLSKNKGNLSFKNLLKLSFRKPIKNKILFPITSIISICSIISFLFLFIFTNINTNEVLLKKQLNENQTGCFISNINSHYDHGSYFKHYDKSCFSDEQINKILNFSNNTSPISDLKVLENLYYYGNYPDVFVDNVKTNYALSYFSDFRLTLEVNSEDYTKGFGLIDCKELSEDTNNRFPNTYDEISINTILAKAFVKYGCYIILDNSKTLEQFRPSKIDDLIGKRLYNGYKIVGVYSSTDGIEEYFEPYIFEENLKFKNNKESDYFNRMLGAESVSKYLYVKPGYYNQYYSNTYKIVPYYINLSGNYDKDIEFINSLSYKLHYVEIDNKYSGFVAEIHNFRGTQRFICWLICACLLLIDLILFLVFFKSNSKKDGKYKRLKIKGANKNVFISLMFIQSFALKFLESIISILILILVFLIIDTNLQINELSLSWLSILITIAYVLLVSIFVALNNGLKINKGK